MTSHIAPHDNPVVTKPNANKQTANKTQVGVSNDQQQNISGIPINNECETRLSVRDGGLDNMKPMINTYSTTKHLVK
jgi:hypothetical protein